MSDCTDVRTLRVMGHRIPTLQICCRQHAHSKPGNTRKSENTTDAASFLLCATYEEGRKRTLTLQTYLNSYRLENTLYIM